LWQVSMLHHSIKATALKEWICNSLSLEIVVKLILNLNQMSNSLFPL
jgi:hypothetical protein